MKKIATLLLAIAAFAAHSATFPERTVTLVVPFPAGGGTDVLGRIIAKGMADRLGKPVVIDNKAGAGTLVGAAAVAQARPDGYTLLISSNTTFVITPALRTNVPFDSVRSFESIGLIGGGQLVLLANPSVPVTTVRDVVALAKSQSGKLAYGSFGSGTTAHVAGEMFKLDAGIDLLHVPYKGSAPAMTDLIAGQVQFTFETLTAALPMLNARKVKAIAVSGAKRSEMLPNIPTIAETGYPGFEMVTWLAIVAPRGLPDPTKAALSNALAATLADPAVRDSIQKTGLEVRYEPGSAFDKKLAAELPLLRAIVHKAKITPD